eukprot:6208499-Pleurochrysis_carterae.AAC.2
MHTAPPLRRQLWQRYGWQLCLRQGRTDTAAIARSNVVRGALACRGISPDLLQLCRQAPRHVRACWQLISGL